MAKQVPPSKLPSSGGGVWGTVFKALLTFLGTTIWAERKNIWEWLCQQQRDIVAWWQGKKIAILGSRGAGKNCFFCKLQGKSVPTNHLPTKSPDTQPKFTFKRALPDGSPFEMTCKRSVNVGGEEEQRERHWHNACQGADVIFYLLTVEDLLEKRYGEGSRIDADCAWLAKHLGRLEAGVRVHFLVNKIDLVFGQVDELRGLQGKLGPDLDALEQRVRLRFGHFPDRLTGISPISMLNEDLFERCLPLVLKAVYDAIHPAP